MNMKSGSGGVMLRWCLIYAESETRGAYRGRTYKQFLVWCKAAFYAIQK